MKSFIELVLIISLLACNQEKTSAPSAKANNTLFPKEERILYDVLQAVEVRPDDNNYAAVSPDEINKKLKDTLLQPHEILMIYHGATPDDLREGKQQFELNNNDLAHGWWETSLVHEGMLDDSVDGKKVYMLIRPDGERYRIYSIREQVRCKKGRGHQEWSKKPCQ